MSNTITNHKEHVKAIILRSEREVRHPQIELTGPQLKAPRGVMAEHLKEIPKEKHASKAEKPREVKSEIHSCSIHDPPNHFPQRLKKDELGNQFFNFFFFVFLSNCVLTFF